MKLAFFFKILLTRPLVLGVKPLTMALNVPVGIVSADFNAAIIRFTRRPV